MSFRCELCGEEFKTAQGLAGHRQFKHGHQMIKDDMKLLLAMDAILRGEDMVEIPIKHRVHPSVVLEASGWINELSRNRLVTSHDLEELKSELKELKKCIIMLGLRVMALESFHERHER